jgi:hypothetical protein
MNYHEISKKKVVYPVADSASIINFFMEYLTHDVLGKIDNSHLSWAD